MANPDVERVFKPLHELLKHGEFTRHDLLFMEKFLDAALTATRNLLAKANAEKDAEV